MNIKRTEAFVYVNIAPFLNHQKESHMEKNPLTHIRLIILMYKNVNLMRRQHQHYMRNKAL